MMQSTRTHPLTEAQWDAIRRAYEYDPDNPSMEAAARRAAEKLGFRPPSRAGVHKRSKAEGWLRRGSMAGIIDAAHRKADRLVSGDGRTEPDPQEVKLAYEERLESEDQRAEVLARHRREWQHVITLRQEAIDIRGENQSEAMDRARLAKTVAEVTKLHQDGERRAWGLDEVVSLPDMNKMTEDELRAVAAGRVPGR